MFIYKKSSASGLLFIMLSVLLSVFFISMDAFAAVSSSDEAIREIERRRFETEKKLREKERIGLELKEGEKQETDKKETEKKGSGINVVEDGNRFLINKIILENDELLSGREKRNLLEPFLNKEISYNDLTILVRSITNILIDKGYITARVKIPLNQNIKSGVITLTIINGYIGRISPESDSLRDRLQVSAAFPFFEGNYLNIKDLDYGIEQMNRLQSNNATMKIIPGDETGSSKVVIYNDTRSRLGLDVGYDNLGQKNTGEQRGKLTVNIDDLLSFNDNVSFDYTKSMNSDTDKKYNRSYTMFFSLPVGYWTFSSVYSRSEYMQYISGLSRDFKSSGDDTSMIFSIERMIGRYKYNRFKGKSSLTLKNKESFIEDAKIETTSRKLSIFKAGLDYSTYLFGGYFSGTANYHRGLKYFDAYKDGDDLTGDTPRAQFDKYDMSILWNKTFTIFGQYFGYLLNSYGQYGMDTLYSSEKISIGDMNSVRGFRDSSITGDRGFYIRNDLSVFDFSSIWSCLKGLKFFTGYDYGYIIEKEGKDSNYGRGKGYITGYSTGIVYTSGIINVNFTYSKKHHQPDFLDENSHIIYCTATMSISGLGEETWNMFTKKNDKKE